jgi:NADPH:quinone reductase-like Zn-dependent oxidoreductase
MNTVARRLDLSGSRVRPYPYRIWHADLCTNQLGRLRWWVSKGARLLPTVRPMLLLRGIRCRGSYRNVLRVLRCTLLTHHRSLPSWLVHRSACQILYGYGHNVSLEAAALVEPLAVAWHAVNISPFKPNDNVLVLGGGPVGIGIIQVLELQGAKNIMVAELTENRKRFASNYGATHILDPREVDVAAKVRELTDGVGADVVFDTAGVEVALNGAIVLTLYS